MSRLDHRRWTLLVLCLAALFPAAAAARGADAKSFRISFELADTVLRDSPNDREALGNRAAANLGLGRTRAAIRDATSALRLDPKDGRAYTTRALANYHEGDYPQAIEDARRALTLNKNNETAFFIVKMAETQLTKAEQLALDPEVRVLADEIQRQYHETWDSRPAAQRQAPARAWRVILFASLGGALIAFGLLQRLELPLRLRRKGERIPAGPQLQAGYRVLRSIAHGGMGEILEAEDMALDRKVAIKKMRDEIRLNDHERERFLREARIVASLRHPNIVDIHTIIEEGDDLYLVFELVEGRSVEQLLGRKGRLKLSDARAILHGAAKALDYAHRHGVVHRDLKPSNIMITDDGVVKVMDFGIAHLSKVQAPSTSTNTVVGTPLYMAPEQERGEVRRESDVYALGACLYEMVTGHRAFPLESASALKRAKNYVRPSSLVPELPAALDSLIDASLEPDPDLRLRSAAEFRALLDALRDPSSIKV